VNMEPYEWNVVILGFWNPAILTPAGIAKRLLGLEENTPIGVEVPLDGLAPFRVKYDNVTVTAEVGRLTILSDLPEYDLLARSMKIATKAICSLPETPLTAAGFNLKFRIDDPTDDLIAALVTPLDNRISDAEFSIKSRRTKRSLEYDKGTLNLDIKLDETQKIKIHFNFHRQSAKQEDLTEWLETPIDKVRKTVNSINKKVFQCGEA